MHPQRLTRPLIRREQCYPKGPLSSEVASSVAGRGKGRRPGGVVDYDDVLPAFREASWEEALDRVASELLQIKQKSGPGALAGFADQPFVLQQFHKAARLPVRYYDFHSGEVKGMHGRVLLRPYYYVVGDEVRLGGIQAIACPADKKILHGMTDAILVPCAVRVSEDASPA